MTSKLKGFAKDSFYYAVGDWVGRLGALILVPILSRIFLPSDYGVIDLLNTTFVFLLVVISLNIDSGVQKFYYLREGQTRKVLVSSTMLLRFVISTLVAVVIFVFSEDISLAVFKRPDYYVEICILAVVLPVEDLYSQLKLLLRLKRMAVAYSMYNVSHVVMQPLLTYLLVVNVGMNISGVFMARLVVVFTMSLILIISQRRCFTSRVKLKEASEIMKFSLPGLPSIIQMNIMNLMPRYFLVSFSTLTAVGLFGIADRVAKTVDMFKGSFNSAWNPFAFSNAGKADEKYLYEKVFKVFALSLLLLTILLSVFAKEILVLLAPPRYHSASVLVGGLCFYYAFRALTLIYSTGLYSVNRVAHTSLMASIQVVTFVACAFYLVPLYEEVGLILSLDIAIIVYFVAYTITVKKFFTFNMSAVRLTVVLIVTIGFAVLLYRLTPEIKAISLISITQKLVLLGSWLVVTCFVLFKKSERNNIYWSVRGFLEHKT